MQDAELRNENGWFDQQNSHLFPKHEILPKPYQATAKAEGKQEQKQASALCKVVPHHPLPSSRLMYPLFPEMHHFVDCYDLVTSFGRI